MPHHKGRLRPLHDSVAAEEAVVMRAHPEVVEEAVGEAEEEEEEDRRVSN